MKTVRCSKSQIDELKEQLKAAGYDTNVDENSLNLVITLFKDVLKGARYGKAAHQIIEQKNKQLTEFETKLKSSCDSTDNNTKHRLFRLIRLAGTCVYIATQIISISNSTECSNSSWGIVSTGLLGMLYNSENSDIKNENVEYWRVLEERDFYIDEVKEKDSVIADLLSKEDADYILQNIDANVFHKIEKNLLDEIENLKNLLERTFCSDEAKAGTEPLLLLVEKTQRENIAVKRHNQILESKINSLENQLSENHKVYEEDGDNQKNLSYNVDSDSFKSNYNTMSNSNFSGSTNVESLRKIAEERRKLVAALDSKSSELRLTKNKVANLSSDIETLKISNRNLENELMMKEEEITGLTRRFELYQEELNEIEMQRIEESKKILNYENSFQKYNRCKQELISLKQDLESAQLNYITTDKALSEKIDELADVKKKYARYAEEKRRYDLLIKDLKNEIRRIQDECKNKLDDINELKNQDKRSNLEILRLNTQNENLKRDLNEQKFQFKETEKILESIQNQRDMILQEKEEMSKHVEELRILLDDSTKKLNAISIEEKELKRRVRFLSVELANKVSSQEYNKILNEANKFDKQEMNVDDETHLKALIFENSLLNDKLETISDILTKTLSAKQAVQSKNMLQANQIGKMLSIINELKDKLFTLQPLVPKLDIYLHKLDHKISQFNTSLNLNSLKYNFSNGSNDQKLDMNIINSKTINKEPNFNNIHSPKMLQSSDEKALHDNIENMNVLVDFGDSVPAGSYRSKAISSIRQIFSNFDGDQDDDESVSDKEFCLRENYGVDLSNSIYHLYDERLNLLRKKNSLSNMIDKRILDVEGTKSKNNLFESNYKLKESLGETIDDDNEISNFDINMMNNQNELGYDKSIGVRDKKYDDSEILNIVKLNKGVLNRSLSTDTRMNYKKKKKNSDWPLHSRKYRSLSQQYVGDENLPDSPLSYEKKSVEKSDEKMNSEELITNQSELTPIISNDEFDGFKITKSDRKFLDTFDVSEENHVYDHSSEELIPSSTIEDKYTDRSREIYSDQILSFKRLDTNKNNIKVINRDLPNKNQEYNLGSEIRKYKPSYKYSASQARKRSFSHEFIRKKDHSAKENTNISLSSIKPQKKSINLNTLLTPTHSDTRSSPSFNDEIDLVTFDRNNQDSFNRSKFDMADDTMHKKSDASQSSDKNFTASQSSY